MSLQHVEDVKTNQAITLPTKPDSDMGFSDANIEDYLGKFLDINENAKDNDKKDKTMPLAEGLKTFPKAAIWSVVLSTALIMEGYDTNLLNSMYAMPAFKEKYGELVDSNDPSLGYEVPSSVQTTLSMCVYVGEIIGLAIAGVVADRIGYRYTLIGALCFTTCFIFIVFFAKDANMLIAGELLLGIPWGAFQTLTVSYASEVCPTVLRIYLTTYVNVCWVFGQLISSGVLRGLVDNNTDLAYRIPFALQWIWPLPIMVGIYFAPESPWWLVKKGKLAQAKVSLTRLLTVNKYLPDKEVLAEAMLNKIQFTITEENLRSKTGSSYLDCFRGEDWRRTRIASMVWLVQNITGSALMGYSTYFYVQAGLSTSMSFTFSLIQYALGIVGTLGSWFASQKFGRFDLYFGGLVVNFTILLVVGCLGTQNGSSYAYGAGSLLLVFTFVYDITVGPICYCLVAEIPSAKLRTKTIIIARNVYNIAGIVIAVITPYMLNPTAWNWGAKTGFFWGGFALLSFIWCWFELPETKGKTFAELNALFSQKVHARKFKSTEVEIFNTDDLINDMGKDGVRDLVLDTEKVENLDRS